MVGWGFVYWAVLVILAVAAVISLLRGEWAAHRPWLGSFLALLFLLGILGWFTFGPVVHGK
jgi:hypothetical protein